LIEILERAQAKGLGRPRHQREIKAKRERI
jgi:hypothetical protein